MGILPLQFLTGESAQSLGLSGRETFAVEGIAAGVKPGQQLTVVATDEARQQKRFAVKCRIDTPVEVEYHRHGGILPYMLRSLAK